MIRIFGGEIRKVEVVFFFFLNVNCKRDVFSLGNCKLGKADVRAVLLKRSFFHCDRHGESSFGKRNPGEMIMRD